MQVLNVGFSFFVHRHSLPAETWCFAKFRRIYGLHRSDNRDLGWGEMLMVLLAFVLFLFGATWRQQ